MNAKAVFSPLIERAIELAAEWHAETYRKGRWRPPAFSPPGEAQVRVPVMAHLTATALTVQRGDWPDAVVAAAFLHDVLEDESAYDERLDRAALQDAVGREVTDLVVAVTEKKVDADGNRRPWKARKEDYVDQLHDEPPEAVAISLADKLHNLWTICQTLETGDNPFAEGTGTSLNAGPEEQQWFYRAVLEASRTARDARLEPLRDRLEEELERFERLVEEQA